VGESPAGGQAHALTIDVEEWFQVENLSHLIPPERWHEHPSRLRAQVEDVLGLLDAAETKATFFVLGKAVEREPGVVRAIVERGHELGCHGWSHELIYRQSPDVFREETRRSKALLEDLGGCAVHGYRASTFSITERSLWALDVLVEEGFVYDSSIAPLRHDRYGIPDAPTEPHIRETSAGPILECPIAFGKFLFSRVPLGGGFVRLLPASWTIRALESRERADQLSVLYFHPWEFDPDQPIPDSFRGLRRFRHTYGLGHFRDKMERVIRRCRFAPLRDLVCDLLPDSPTSAPTP